MKYIAKLIYLIFIDSILPLYIIQTVEIFNRRQNFARNLCFLLAFFFGQLRSSVLAKHFFITSMKNGPKGKKICIGLRL